MLDITQNFIDRINRLDVLFDTPQDLCKVVTFDQSIRIKSQRETILAEDFRDQDHYQVYLNYAADTEDPVLDPQIMGFLSRDHIFILLKLPPLIQINHIAEGVDGSYLSIELHRPDVVYDRYNPLNCEATMYRIEGDPWHGLLYDRDDHANTAYLAHDWEDQLKAMLRAQVSQRLQVHPQEGR